MSFLLRRYLCRFSKEEIVSIINRNYIKQSHNVLLVTYLCLDVIKLIARWPETQDLEGIKDTKWNILPLCVKPRPKKSQWQTKHTSGTKAKLHSCLKLTVKQTKIEILEKKWKAEGELLKTCDFLGGKWLWQSCYNKFCLVRDLSKHEPTWMVWKSSDKEWVRTSAELLRWPLSVAKNLLVTLLFFHFPFSVLKYQYKSVNN